MPGEKYIERPRAKRLLTVAEWEECEDHTEKNGGCDGCPHLRVASVFDAYCAQSYVWPGGGTD